MNNVPHTIPQFVLEAIQGGIDVTIMRHAIYGMAYDMNLQAKSHMHIVYKPELDSWWALMRYDQEYQISDVDELKWAARQGMHGRDYMNHAWFEFLMTPEERAERALAQQALARLTPDERAAIARYSEHTTQ